MKEFIDASPPYLLSIGAAVCLVLAVISCWQGRLKEAGILGAFFFLCVVLAYLPQTENIKAFAVEVKLRRTLDRAEEILARLKDLSLTNAKMSYMTVAWGNRLGAPS